MEIPELNLRDYQYPVVEALEEKEFKRLMIIWPRRGGKDLVALHLAARQCLRKVCSVYYIFPTFNQARTSLWDGISIGGVKILDYIPSSLCKKNNSEMKVTFHNGSILQFIGSDRYDRLRGTNPLGIVFSEYAYQDPRVFDVASPILAANNGWAIFVSTPFGKNAFYDLYQEALIDKENWFVHKLTVDDTKHITQDALDKEKARLSTPMYLQEYFTSFDCGVAGSIYGKEMNDLRLDNRITSVLYDPSYPVHVSFDIGIRDATSLIFFQVIGNTVHIIDCYENNNHGAEHYVKIIKEKPYTYGHYIVPHDIRVREWGTGLSRIEQLSNFGLEVTESPNVRKLDGIEAVRVGLRKTIIDSNKCKDLIKALNNYHYKWDAVRNRFIDHEPMHDWSSNFCFTGDMKVKTPSGDVQIKDIKIGDEVLTPLGIRKVLKKHERYAEKLCKINDSIECTPEHSIFTQSGLTSADSLKYDDILEPYSKFRSFLWKKIFGYYTEEHDTRGFKKTILSLKMKKQSCLMDIFIDGMRQNTTWVDLEEQTMGHRIQVKVDTLRFKGIFGKTIMGRFLRGMLSIIKMGMQKTIRLITLKCLQGMNMDICTQQIQIHGVNHRSAKINSEVLTQKQQNGIEVKRVGHGIGNMQKTLYRLYEVLSIRRNVLHAKKIIQEKMLIKNTAVQSVAQDKGYWIVSILKKGIVLSAIKSLNVINMLSRKHAVKSVVLYQADTPEKVYDLTIEHDNAYYINGYLVSNCDSAQYLFISVPSLQDDYTAEDIDEMKLGASRGYGPRSYGNR